MSEGLTKKEQKELDRLSKKSRASGKIDSRFDINLLEGKYAEELVASLLKNATKIEVKKDYAVSRTGNVAVEVMHDGIPSGISTSQAEFYAFVLGGTEYNDEIVFFIRTKRLWSLVEKMISQGKLREAKKKGESDFVPIPIVDLLKRRRDI